MARDRHPNKHIEAEPRAAEALGFRVRKATGHAWGVLLCPLLAREGCSMSVNSTPRNPEAHARQVRQFVAACPHRPSG